jgi:hypothetical protein
MRLSLQAIARPECRLPFVNSPTLFLEKHRRIAAMTICTIVHSVVPWPARSLRALAISPAGILIGFGPEKFFLFDVESGRFSRHDWVGMELSSGIFVDENRFLVAAPEPGGNYAVRLLELPAHTVRSLGESVSLRFFETLGQDTLLAAADGAGIVKVSIHDY